MDNGDKGIISRRIKLFVSVSPISTADVPTVNSLPLHHCDNNKPTFKELSTYFTKISSDWKEIAIQLGIPKSDVVSINIDYPSVADKCYEMFTYWLNRTEHPCWCQFVQALYEVGLRK